ncbi:unnamed protein product [Staurois parvus]|uniref:Reverse transcriptase n=1 Tax=Staurois parvus TaxID=386267 RepID=A0ABN9FQE9_9NEOB|nr:unnamed protein product [Staurois parvus]
MHSWQFTHLSWIGRINSVKMTILSKLLYYFRTLPVRVPPNFFRLVQAKIMRFIWADKHPRVSRTTLFVHRLQAGLGVPNVTNNIIRRARLPHYLCCMLPQTYLSGSCWNYLIVPLLQFRHFYGFPLPCAPWH